MEQCPAVDGRIQKNNSRINNGHDLSDAKLSDVTGDAMKRGTDETITTAGPLPSSAKSANSSPACQELPRIRSVEKFVFEVDKLAAAGHADRVSHFCFSLLEQEQM